MIRDLPDLAVNPSALRVTKKPIPVHADFPAADGVCETLEGKVHFRAGDAILTGTEGERWTIRRELFMSNYEAVPPTLAGTNGAYTKKPALAYAMQLDAPRQVPVGWQDDPLHGNPGDWLLQYADGTYGVVQDEIFRKTYGPAADELRWPPP